MEIKDVLKDFRFIALGIYAVLPASSNAQQRLAKTYGGVDKVKAKIEKVVKFDASKEIIHDFDKDIKTNDEAVKEVLQPKEVIEHKGVLTSPYASSYTMENGVNIETYGGEEGVVAVRYVASQGNASYAVNVEMDKDLVAKVDNAIRNNDDVELMKLAREMVKVQNASGKDSKQIVRDALKGYAFDESRQKSGMPYMARVDMALQDAKGTAFTAWAMQAAKSQNAQ